MAIVGQIAIESRRYSGWTDPRYPIGYWFAALSLTGDASGGNHAIDLLFQPSDPPRLNSQMYSVERFGVTVSSATDKIHQIAAVNMSGPSNLGFQHEYSVTIVGQNGLTKAGVNPASLQLLPWFLGSQRTAGISASLSLISQNLDGVIVIFEAEGYRWGARSVLVDGGPQRPPTGPYGQ